MVVNFTIKVLFAVDRSIDLIAGSIVAIGRQAAPPVSVVSNQRVRHDGLDKKWSIKIMILIKWNFKKIFFNEPV